MREDHRAQQPEFSGEADGGLEGDRLENPDREEDECECVW